MAAAKSQLYKDQLRTLFQSDKKRLRKGPCENLTEVTKYVFAKTLCAHSF